MTTSDATATTHAVELAELRERGHVRVASETCAALVTWVEGTAYAVDDSCPHRGTSLSDGLVRDGVVTCPAHLWQYDVRTGARHDTVGHGLTTYPVTVTEGTVEVTLPRPTPTPTLREILQAHAREARPPARDVSPRDAHSG